jgi:ECF transporter S component (folate family)
MKISTKQIVYTGFLISLSIILTRFLSLRFSIGGVEGIRIGLGNLPLIVAGFVFGPLAGALAGAIADVLGYIISPVGGAYMPHFTLTTALIGAMPALLLKLKRSSQIHTIDLILALGLSQLIVRVILLPYFLHSLFGLPLKVIVPGFLIGEAIVLPLYVVLLSEVEKRVLPVLST